MKNSKLFYMATLGYVKNEGFRRACLVVGIIMVVAFVMIDSIDRGTLLHHILCDNPRLRCATFEYTRTNNMIRSTLVVFGIFNIPALVYLIGAWIHKGFVKNK